MRLRRISNPELVPQVEAIAALPPPRASSTAPPARTVGGGTRSERMRRIARVASVTAAASGRRGLHGGNQRQSAAPTRQSAAISGNQRRGLHGGTGAPGRRFPAAYSSDAPTAARARLGALVWRRRLHGDRVGASSVGAFVAELEAEGVGASS